jgi:hypothetical protein
MEVALRIVDCFFLDGPKVLFQVGLALLTLHRDAILATKDPVAVCNRCYNNNNWLMMMMMMMMMMMKLSFVSIGERDSASNGGFESTASDRFRRVGNVAER